VNFSEERVIQKSLKALNFRNRTFLVSQNHIQKAIGYPMKTLTKWYLPTTELFKIRRITKANNLNNNYCDHPEAVNEARKRDPRTIG